MSFCSREQPTVVCQEIAIDVDAASDLKVRARIDLSGIEGRPLRYNRDTPGEAKPSSDGSLLWESAGAISTCGLAYVTEFVGDDAKPQRPPLDGEGLRSEYALRARRGRQYKLRQLVSLVPSALHNQPDYQAARLIAMAANIGFDAIRKNNQGLLGRIVEEPNSVSGRREALASHGGRRILLPDIIDPRLISRFDVHVRLGDLA